jgi:hypothetical protein
MAMVRQANVRGIKTDKNLANINALVATEGKYWGTDVPKWYENNSIMKKVTTTHKANLHRKDPTYYSHFIEAVGSKHNKPCCERCQYYWVTHKEAAVA